MYEVTSSPKTQQPHHKSSTISEVFEDDTLDLSYNLEEYPTIQLQGDELFGVITNTMCQFTQEIITFPIHNIYITSQIMTNSSPSYYFPWSVTNSLYTSYMLGGGSLLWRGFPSYIILNGSLAVGDTVMCYTTKKYVSSRWLSRSLIFIERCLANFIVAPFYTTMMVDCVMSDSITGIRNPLFFIVEGSKLLFSQRNRYRNSVFSYLSSRPLNIYNRYVTYTLMVFGRFLVSSIVCRFYAYAYGRKKLNMSDPNNNNNSNNNNLSITINDTNDDTMYLDRIEFTQNCCDKLSIDLLTNITTDLLMIPIMTSGIRCLLQGLDLFVDSVSTSSSLDIVGTHVIPTSHTYFRDIFECITTTYDEFGYMGGFCKGLGAIALGSLVKYCVVNIFKRMLCFYRQVEDNNNQGSISYYED